MTDYTLIIKFKSDRLLLPIVTALDGIMRLVDEKCTIYGGKDYKDGVELCYEWTDSKYPEDHKWVLACDTDGTVQIANHDAEGWWGDDGYRVGGIVAWMELPRPYK